MGGPWEQGMLAQGSKQEGTSKGALSHRGYSPRACVLSTLDLRAPPSDFGLSHYCMPGPRSAGRRGMQCVRDMCFAGVSIGLKI
jgi:hypothetical protein